ncbi:MAG: hypothetical protein HN833_00355 [Elusimicrobiaceae bacterium]|jgi:cell division protein FtsB|nr:hypothetical protein [Elusimicrobiaceae bacterium]MBT3955325.1 hypothetical protein [Elusimicrobiaceae bacterium]MBT4008461.1 hypothetical protein [Elusimicrobiaceae bacterium]MBT4403349.1 hypothetical protein [Elusimicrobiaceae bacterium]MBT4440190.1 hypothetical protein [Elusimicrobiaceae bacterium]
MPKIRYSKNKYKPNIKFSQIIKIIIALAVIYLVFNGNVRSIIFNSLEIGKLKKEDVKLDKEFIQLNNQLEKLQANDKAYLEYLARTKYNLTKKDEIEFRFKAQK